MVDTTNLLAYYKLDESSGNRADAHGSFTLTDNNTVLSATGIINSGSDHIKANNEYLSNTSFGASVSANDWSVSLWYNFPSVTGQTVFGLRPSSGAANLIQIETDPTISQVRLIVRNSSNVTRKDYNNTTAPADAWNHIVVTRTGDTVEMYVNGSNASTTKSTNATLVMTSTARTLYIGAELSASNVADGVIDEVGFWNRLLTSTEVTELYNAGAGLAYPFSGGGGGAPTPLLAMMGVGS
jgi:hypothetical protein